MSTKQQKLRHGKNSLSEAIITEDVAYLPSSSLRDRLGCKLRPEKRAIKEKAPRRVPRPRYRNRRDPFHTLNDDGVNMIIALLPARDTEILRRVSKLWKASSEYHCGKSALLRFFPWAAAKANKCETEETANLLFRRCLHYQANLEAGLATRAIRCDGAIDWDLHENRLIWCGRSKVISIRDLRTPEDHSAIESKILGLDTSHILPGKTCRPYTRILPGGEFLVTTFLIEDSLSQSHQLRKISARGTVLWSVNLEASMTRPAIGKDNVYFIHGPHCQEDTRTRQMSFAKYRLCDGSMVFDVTMPPEFQSHWKIQEINKSMVLTEDETLAVWKYKSCNEVNIFSAESGQHIVTRDWVNYKNAPLFQNVLPSCHTAAGFWTTTTRSVHLTTCNHVSRSFVDVNSYIIGGDSLNEPRSMAFDGNHSIFLRTCNASGADVGEGAKASGTLNPFTQFAVLKLALASIYGLNSAKTTAVVTLPGRSKADGKRRDFELELPWEMEEGDFFGMMNEYLIYQSPKNELLVLVDFWPSW